jgi:FtsP/CotA-like multicopper oxidase with cupredoxin domain
MAPQNPNSVWCFNGTLPPPLVLGRYGEPILFRHHNGLPPKVGDNNGFGRHTISTHEHNGHHGYENDGFTGAFFYPGQYYDYHWPIVHAGFGSINVEATDPRCGSPDGSGRITKLPGNWQETMSTHWFHDHMFAFTAQNVYKGNAAMFNLYSSLDRGNETINDGVNFRLPSGTRNDWGNLDYDVNLMIADKAFDQTGQLYFDIFNLDGFLGDVMTVNACYKPFFQVEARKYRFRILNASVSRFFKIALCDDRGNAVPMIQIGNDGNLLPRTVTLTELDEQGIAERYDIVIDFSNFVNKKLYLVNLCEHQDGTKPSQDMRLADALTPGKSHDPCVGKFLEFQVGARTADLSQVPATLIPNPVMPAPVRTRTFEFGRGGGQDGLPWTIKVDGGQSFNADYAKTSAMPQIGTSEIWTLKNGGGGWDHPIHIHFEEGQILKRNGSASNVPPWEKGRKDVYRLHPSGDVTIQLQFREFAGMYMEHCHNTQHEDNAMLLRWDIDGGGLVPIPAPNPSPQGTKQPIPTTTT